MFDFTGIPYFIVVFLDAKQDEDDDNVNVNVEDEDEEKIEKGKKEDKEEEAVKGTKNKENGGQEIEDREKGMPKLSLGSKKRKNGVEKSLELVFDKFKQANSEDFERYVT